MKVKKRYVIFTVAAIVLSNLSPTLLSAQNNTIDSSQSINSYNNTSDSTTSDSNSSNSDILSTTSSNSSTATTSEESTKESSTEKSTEDSSSTTTSSTNTSSDDTGIVPESEIPEDLKNNPYFPTKPTEKDIRDAYISPNTTTYSQKEVVGPVNRSSRALSAKNTEIIKNPLATIKTSYAPEITYQKGYADGVGKPRGIVIHETANSNSTIWNEIAYMTRNWQNAFVHAFVDQSNIVEIAPTQYIAWGAGPNANKYYIHVELVEHPGNLSAFYKSINNQSYYAAYNLKKYNLLPSRAQSNGSGSVWGHFEVSDILGGTDHGDPLGYFATFGYTFQEFYDLVAYHYNNTLKNYAIITSQKNVSTSAVVKNNVSGYGIHNVPWNTIGSTINGYMTNYAKSTVQVTEEAITSFGETYVNISQNGKKIGWVNKNALQYVDTIISQEKMNQTAQILSPETAGVGKINSAVNIPGTQPIDSVLSNNTAESGQVVKILEKAVTNKATYYKYQQNNSTQTGYYPAKALHLFDNIEYNRVFEKNAELLSGTSGDLITKNIYNTEPNEVYLGNGQDYAGQKVQILREAKTAHASWYQFSINGKVIGWMNQRAFKLYDDLISQTDVNENWVVNPTKSSGLKIYSEIPNIGKGEKEVATLSTYVNRRLTVVKKAVTTSGTYFKVKDPLGSDLGWTSEKGFQAYTQTNTLGIATHVQDIGWQSPAGANQIAGTTGKNKQLEALKIQLSGTDYNGSIEYSSYVAGTGWETTWAKDNSQSGTTGKNKRLEALKIRLTSTMATKYDIYYQVHVQDFGWLDWAKNGAAAGTQGYNKYIEAVRVVLVKKGAAAPGDTQDPLLYTAPTTSTSAYVENLGWLPAVGSNQVIGTTGKALQMEAIKINLVNTTPYSGNIKYQAHVTDSGWLTSVTSGQIAGTTGKNKSLQAITITLTGDIAKYYDIYYQVYTKKYGWLDWAKNGAQAGTLGYNQAAEAMRIVIVKKGDKAPGTTTTPVKIAPPKISTTAHVQNLGWLAAVGPNVVAGTTGKNLSMEAFKLTLGTNNTPYSGGLTYSAHVTDYGWMSPVITGAVAGTTGKNKSLQALSINLTGALAEHYDIFYRVHIQNKGWLDWAKNGDQTGSVGLNLGAQAMQVVILDKGDVPSGYKNNGLILLGQVNSSTSSGKFINSIINTVAKTAPKAGLFSSVMMAQAILESGYGTSKLAADANNYFGMKFKEGEDEGHYDYVEYSSNEQLPDGSMVPIVSKFRKYRTIPDSFSDNAYKLVHGVSWDSSYYEGTWKENCKTYKDATAALQGRYTPTITYAASLNKLIEQWHLDQFD